jgi:hypothetical protein
VDAAHTRLAITRAATSHHPGPTITGPGELNVYDGSPVRVRVMAQRHNVPSCSACSGMHPTLWGWASGYAAGARRFAAAMERVRGRFYGSSLSSMSS